MGARHGARVLLNIGNVFSFEKCFLLRKVEIYRLPYVFCGLVLHYFQHSKSLYIFQQKKEKERAVVSKIILSLFHIYLLI